MAISIKLEVPGCALAVGAHPDDVEFGCGATLAKWAAAGCRIHHLVCTDGSKGTWDPEVDQQALVATRREEQRRAAETLGARDEPVFLGWPDGELDAASAPAGRSPTGSASSVPTWSWATTPGSATASIPTTAMPASC